MLLSLLALTGCSNAPAAQSGPAATAHYKVVETIAAPEGSYDYASIDSETRQLFVGREYGVMRTNLKDGTSILLDPAKLLEMLCCGGKTDREEPIAIDIAVQIKRRGHELKLIYAAPEARPAMRDDRLVQLLGQGRIAYQQLLTGALTGSARAVRLARLQVLAPDIVTARVNVANDLF